MSLALAHDVRCGCCSCCGGGWGCASQLWDFRFMAEADITSQFPENATIVPDHHVVATNFGSGVIGNVYADSTDYFPIPIAVADVVDSGPEWAIEIAGIAGNGIRFGWFDFTGGPPYGVLTWGVFFYDEGDGTLSAADLLGTPYPVSWTIPTGGTWHIGVAFNLSTGMLTPFGDITGSPAGPVSLPAAPDGVRALFSADYDGLQAFGVLCESAQYPQFDFTAPDAPASGTFLHDGAGVEATWAANEDADFDHYVVELWDDAGGGD